MGTGDTAGTSIRVGDANSQVGPGGEWTVAAGGLELALAIDPADGQLVLSGLRNLLAGTPVESALPARLPLFDLGLAGKGRAWHVEAAEARQVAAGGRPALELQLGLTTKGLRVVVGLLAYPGYPVLRQRIEVENTGAEPISLGKPVLFQLVKPASPDDHFSHLWMVGANNRLDAGMIRAEQVGPGYSRSIDGNKTWDFNSWSALQRDGDPRDGLAVWLDYFGRWTISVQRPGTGPARLTVSTSIDTELAPGARLELPLVTLGAHHGDLDDLMERMYGWQYTYLWDYANHDYFTRMPWDTAWYMWVYNLQENFAGRLAHLDMDFADLIRAAGLNMMWDDAGWSENPEIWAPSREGPNFGQTLRYLAKQDIKWLLWFCGHPTAELMDSKAGAWGNFQWRTDGQGNFDYALDRSLRDRVKHWLDLHPLCSFHTCDGGSGYAHGLEIQRFADTNMLADPGTGDQSNYYYSYWELPDRWHDIMVPWYSKGVWLPDIARQNLTMVPAWNLYTSPEGVERLQRMTLIYRFLLREGVAGRWSYMHHPRIEGDLEYYYAQRTSYDRTKAVIIPKHQHRLGHRVRIYPRGLLPDHLYTVDFDSHPAGAPFATEWAKDPAAPQPRTGADLMRNGIQLGMQSWTPEELIYLGMPDRPGSGRDTTPPTAPGQVLIRREVNIGHSGVGVYWSPGADGNLVSHYEVRRDGHLLGRVATGTFYFDRTPGWDPEAGYAVRTVDGDGNASQWTLASRLPDEPLEFAALGGHFAEVGREGWRAETTDDGMTYSPMTWVAAAWSAAGDMGGTGKQPGGVEGYWEGAGGARVGRGWQQAGQGTQCVRTWVAPANGRVRVLGRVAKEYYRRNQGKPLHVRIMHGGQVVWPQGPLLSSPKDGWATIGLNDLDGRAHDLTLDVAVGDAVRFVLDAGNGGDADIVAWMPRILYLDSVNRSWPGSEPARVVRMVCGATAPYTDSCCNIWSADRFFAGGKPMQPTGQPIDIRTLPADQALYRAGRAGSDFTYTIPLPPGLYSLRLKWAERQYQWIYSRPMNLDMNGRRVLSNFDPGQAARGAGRAYDFAWHYLAPDAQGQLVLRFTGGWDPLQATDQAMVQAIEVLPEDRPAVRINCGSATAHIDWNSFLWAPDPAGTGRQTLSTRAPVSQATPTLYDQALYRTAASGRELSYEVPVPPGMYTVHLKFAELWLQEPGQRPMDIEVNGARLWSSWDPATAAGQTGMAADLRCEDVAPDARGCITIRVKAADLNDAILQGIEIE